MTIKNALWFSYDGIKSIDYGIINVNIDTGILEETFLSNRQINEIIIKGRDKPYFQGIQKNPLILNLSWAFEETWDDELIREVTRWLDVDYYKELYFSTNINRIFYAIPIEEPKLIHNGLSQGYINLTMRCDSPYSYSPVYEKIYDFSNNSIEGTNIKFENLGDVDLYPELWIQKVGNGDVSIINNGIEFKFTGLADQEEVYINNENNIIITNLYDTYRYDNFNNNYLKLLKYSVNNLTIKGDFYLKMRYQFCTTG